MIDNTQFLLLAKVFIENLKNYIVVYIYRLPMIKEQRNSMIPTYTRLL